MIKVNWVALAAAAILPAAAHAASITYTGFDASHFHAGGNVGGGYTTTSASDRTDGISLSPSGLVLGTAADQYSGNIGTVVGTRRGRAETQSNTFGLMETDGFFFESLVTTQTECIETNITGCVPFMRNQATLTFDFTVDSNTTMFLDGVWVGGNQDPSTISLVDFVGVSLSRVTIAGGTIPVIAGVTTNGAQNGLDSGLISGSVGLTAGTVYRFGINHSAFAQSVSATGAVDNDASLVGLSASFIQTRDLAAYQLRYAALTHQPSPIPLPAAGWMLIAGLGAIGALRRRQRP